MNGFFERIEAAARKKKSRLCVGLDPRLESIPEDFIGEPDPVLAFNKIIIDAAGPYACAFKPNFAFYETLGPQGLVTLKKTIEYVPDDTPVIGDAKRGDIGSTAEAYAKSIFDYYGCDGVTLSPYLGRDSLEPFLKYADKGLYILCLTSNPGSGDFQLPGELYKTVARRAAEWNDVKNCGLVAGATRPEQLGEIRKTAPGLPLLIPGIGAQGGDLEKVLTYAPDEDGGGFVINVSRGISQPKGEGDFADKVRAAAQSYRDAINEAMED